MTAQLDSSSRHWSIRGDMTFETVPALYEQARGVLAERLPESVDLEGVDRVDSAGVALMLEWLRAARTRGQSLRFRNIPRHMASIADLCGVRHLLVEA